MTAPIVALAVLALLPCAPAARVRVPSGVAAEELRSPVAAPTGHLQRAEQPRPSGSAAQLQGAVKQPDDEDMDVVPLEGGDIAADLNGADPFADVSATTTVPPTTTPKALAAAPDAAETPTPTRDPYGESAEEHNEREMEECVDTENWSNNYTNISKELEWQYIMAASDLTFQGYEGMALWDAHKGYLCAAYVYHGLCVNPHWIDESQPNIPCVIEDVMMGKDYKFPENNCCACGKNRPLYEDRTCSHRAKTFVWQNENKLQKKLRDSFVGTPAEKAAQLDNNGLLVDPPVWLEEVETAMKLDAPAVALALVALLRA